MIINMKAHPSKDKIKDQFTDIQNNIEWSKISYGIVSDTKPDSTSSPLGCSLISMQSNISINEFPPYENRNDRDYITINSNDSEYTLYQYQEDDTSKIELYWTYCYDSNNNKDIEATLSSISKAINKISGLKAQVYDYSVIIVGISTVSGIGISNKTRLTLKVTSRIKINSGTVIFKNGNKVTLDKDIYLPLMVENTIINENFSGKTFRILVKYSLSESEFGINETNETVVKKYEILNVDKLFSIEESSNEEPDENTICLGILKCINSIVVIDSSKNIFSYNRPWYSPMDSIHRLNVGTSKITKHNPHGIGYDDIDDEHSLHNNLTQFGLVISPETEIQDISGTVVTKKIYASELNIDFNGIITKLLNTDYDINGNVPYRYYVLPEIPTSIMYIMDDNNNPIYLEWIENTSYLVIPKDSDSININVTYTVIKTLNPSISNKGEGVEVNSINGNDIILSQGKNVTTYSTNITFTNIQNVDNKYDIYVDKNGSIVKIPSVQAIASLDSDSGELNDLVARSRLQLTLTNTPNDIEVNCPTKKIKVSSESTIPDCTIYQTYAIYDSSGDKILESYADPFGVSLSNQTVEGSTEGSIQLNELSGSVQSMLYSNSYEKSYLGALGNSVVSGTTFRGTTFSIQRRTENIVYGGIRIQIALGNLTKDSNPRLVLKKDSTSVIILGSSSTSKINTSILKNGKFGFDITLDDFDGMVHNGTWYLLASDGNSENKVSIDYVKIQWSFGKIKSNVYSSITKNDVTTIRLLNSTPIDNDVTSSMNLNVLSGTEASIDTNKDFSVVVNITGISNDKSLSEKVTFDSSFRNQKGLNSVTTSNVFDSVSKYTIEETSTTGKLTILGYPVGTVGNLCGIFSARYENKKIVEITDTRKVKTGLRQQGNIKPIYEVPQAFSTLKDLL